MSETKKHRCMRCGGEFECRAEGCAAAYDVLPRRIERGPDGQPRVVEHECEPPKESGWKEIAPVVYEEPSESECAPEREVSVPLPLVQRTIAALENMFTSDPEREATRCRVVAELREAIGDLTT